MRRTESKIQLNMYQTITRKGSFDAAHRVMHERVKCFNLPGHTFLYELTFAFKEPEGLGYALDFKEIKRVACAYIDEVFDHCTIINPKDTIVKECVEKLGTKLYEMTINGPGEDCNPSAESIAKEMFIQISALMDTENIWLEKLRLYETPNCWVDTSKEDIRPIESCNVCEGRKRFVDEFRKKVGTFEYDERKC